MIRNFQLTRTKLDTERFTSPQDGISDRDTRRLLVDLNGRSVRLDSNDLYDGCEYETTRLIARVAHLRPARRDRLGPTRTWHNLACSLQSRRVRTRYLVSLGQCHIDNDSWNLRKDATEHPLTFGIPDLYKGVSDSSTPPR